VDTQAGALELQASMAAVEGVLAAQADRRSELGQYMEQIQVGALLGSEGLGVLRCNVEPRSRASWPASCVLDLSCSACEQGLLQIPCWQGGGLVSVLLAHLLTPRFHKYEYNSNHCAQPVLGVLDLLADDA
jgi:hypothetical protein